MFPKKWIFTIIMVLFLALILCITFNTNDFKNIMEGLGNLEKPIEVLQPGPPPYSVPDPGPPPDIVPDPGPPPDIVPDPGEDTASVVGQVNLPGPRPAKLDKPDPPIKIIQPIAPPTMDYPNAPLPVINFYPKPIEVQDPGKSPGDPGNAPTVVNNPGASPPVANNPGPAPAVVNYPPEPR